MFKLEGKKVSVNNHEELVCLFEYANKHVITCKCRRKSDGRGEVDGEINT